MMRSVLYFLVCLNLCASAHADDEESQIVTTCHYANAEWGTDMISRCVDENRGLRNEVLSLPAEYADAVARCRDHAELGWGWVKECVLKGGPQGR